jgi:hypothetical protein
MILIADERYILDASGLVCSLAERSRAAALLIPRAVVPLCDTATRWALRVLDPPRVAHDRQIDRPLFAFLINDIPSSRGHIIYAAREPLTPLST